MKTTSISSQLEAAEFVAAKENAAMADNMLQQGLITDHEHKDILSVLWETYAADSAARSTRLRRSQAALQSLHQMT
jgi:hypothetical protein